MIYQQKDMLPKKIYLNYVDKKDDDITLSDNPIGVSDCNMQNREYTDLSQVWHDASEEPRMNYKNIIYQTNYCSLFNVHIAFVPTCLRSGKITSYSWNEFVKDVNMRRWAYTDDLLPKGGEK